MRSTDQRENAFGHAGETPQRATAPGKQTLTQSLAPRAATTAERGIPGGTLDEGGAPRAGFAPTSRQSYVDEILGAGASDRAGDWEADDALMSAMGLGPVEAHRTGPPAAQALASQQTLAAAPSATGTVRGVANVAAPAAVTVQARPAPRRTAGAAHAATYLELGGEHFSVISGKLVAGREELGEIENASAVLGTLSRSAPTTIVFRPREGVTSPAAGDLLAAAPEGSTVTSNSTVWVRNERAWNRLEGKKKRGGGQFKGVTKSGGGSVRERLTEMTRAGQLRLTGHQIAAMAAVAEVETGGQLGCVQTYDDQVVSIGFKQIVLGHGSLPKVMETAPVGFARHGLILDHTKRYVVDGWRKQPYQIAGCEDVEELRSPEWAIKFYHASLEPDVVSAICDLALADIRQVETATAPHEGASGHNFVTVHAP
jgi:hypothetical protein